MSFLINEDKALKTLLQGITVSDSGNATRPVAVYYGQPDKEIRQQTYPFITVDLAGINEDTERAHRGYVSLTYTPENVGTEHNYSVDFPTPVDLIYQVTTYARQPRHDRQIITGLTAQGRLPFRFGQLHIPEDNTLRRLDMLGFSKRDTMENGKRLFRNIYNIRVSTEIFQADLVRMYQVLEQPIISTTWQTLPFSTNTL
jgi:hypothetical protein